MSEQEQALAGMKEIEKQPTDVQFREYRFRLKEMFERLSQAVMDGRFFVAIHSFQNDERPGPWWCCHNYPDSEREQIVRQIYESFVKGETPDAPDLAPQPLPRAQIHRPEPKDIMFGQVTSKTEEPA